MKYEQEARDRQGMMQKINNLNSMFIAMQSDFAQCAKGKSPCFFCAKDDTCENDANCDFVWARRINEED